MSQDEYLAQAYVLESQTVNINPVHADGLILDIGGGGEGIIGKLNGEKVVAIDKRLDELEETDNDSLKIVMDATDLKFLDGMFGAATLFHTMMYIPNDLKHKVLTEAYRVLKEGCKLYIWDVEIPEKVDDKKYFVIPLKVVMPDDVIETGYGVHFKKQTLGHIKALAENVGFNTVKEETGEHTFYLELEK